MGAMLLTAGTKGKRFALPQRPGHDPPAAGRHRGHDDRDPDPRQGVPADQEDAQRDPGQAHRPDARADREGHRPRQLHVGRRRPRSSAWSIKCWNGCRCPRRRGPSRRTIGDGVRFEVCDRRGPHRRRIRPACGWPPFYWLALALAGAAGCTSSRADLVEAELRTRDRQLRELHGELMRSETMNQALENTLRDQRLRQPVMRPAGRWPLVKDMQLGRGTGGLDEDNCPGDEGFKSSSCRATATARRSRPPARSGRGLGDHAGRAEGAALVVGRVGPASCGKSWRSGLLSTGYFVALPWQTVPRTEKLRIVAHVLPARRRRVRGREGRDGADRPAAVPPEPAAARRRAAAAPRRPPVLPMPRPDTPPPSRRRRGRSSRRRSRSRRRRGSRCCRPRSWAYLRDER